MKLNLSEDKKELFIKTSIWNSFIDVFKQKKSIDVSDYMVSVQIRWKTLLIKTNKPILNAEAKILYDDIYDSFYNKIKYIEMNDYNFELKFL